MNAKSMHSLRPLALCIALLPACWSGFSEIRVAGSDASAPGDRPAIDRPAEDAPRVPDGAQDATADAVSFDTPSVDVVDAGGLEDRLALDAVDAPVPEDARDAAVGIDAVDAPESRDVVAAEDRVEASAVDVVDAPAPADAGPVPDACAAHYTPCPGGCALLFNDRPNCGACGTVCEPGTECVRGLCSGPTRFLGAVTFDPSTYARDPMALVRWDELCAARFGSEARVCTPRELDFLGLGAAACAAIGDADGGVRTAAMYLPAPYFAVNDAGVVTLSAVRCIGRSFDGFASRVSGASVAVCCSVR